MIKQYLERRKKLQQQMDNLSELSKTPLPEHECDYAYAMVEIDRELSKTHPIFITIIGCILIYFSFCLFKKSQ